MHNLGQKQLYYVGHSQGTMIGFIQFSKNGQWSSEKIKQFYALAPVFYLNSPTSPLHYIGPLTDTLDVLFKLIGMDEFAPNSAFAQWLASFACTQDHPHLQAVCENMLFLICGYDEKNMNETRLPVYMSHSPAGTSSRNIIHYGQIYQAQQPQMYDFGFLENQKVYGQRKPPVYSATGLAVPTAIFAGGIDTLADPKDVALLRKDIQSKLFYDQTTPDMDHMDFVWGMNAAKNVYIKMIELLKKDAYSQ